jgi:hypothetical protein
MFYVVIREAGQRPGDDERMCEMHGEGEPKAEGHGGVPPDDATVAEQIAAAWAEGAAGWERLAKVWGVSAPAASGSEAGAIREGAGRAAGAARDVGSAATGDAAMPTVAGGAPAACWWDGPPWYGQIAEEEFRAIVAAYVARYGVYTPDLPEREPELLRGWRREREPGAGEPPQVAA